MMPKCFKCEKEIKSALKDAEPWDAPSGGVSFEGGYNFGSNIYDALIDGIAVTILICDDCLELAGEDRKKDKKRKVTLSSPDPRHAEAKAIRTAPEVAIEEWENEGGK